jgi:hypothetical protein
MWPGGEGSLQDTIASENLQPVNIVIRGIGEMQETALVLNSAYNWEYVSLFAEGTLSLSARYATNYRWQLSTHGPNGREILQEYRTESTFSMQVEGLTIGVNVSL